VTVVVMLCVTVVADGTVVLMVLVRVDVNLRVDTVVVVTRCEMVVVVGTVVVRDTVRIEPSPMFDTIVVVMLCSTVVVEGSVVVMVEVDVVPTVVVVGTVVVIVIGGGAITAIGGIVIVETAVVVLVVAMVTAGMTDVTVVVVPAILIVVTAVDADAEGKITLQSSLPPFSKIVLAILSHTKRLPKAKANAVDGFPLAVLAWVSPESIICRQACTRFITPCARSSCPLTMSSITGKTDPSQNDCSTCARRA